MQLAYIAVGVIVCITLTIILIEPENNFEDNIFSCMIAFVAGLFWGPLVIVGLFVSPFIILALSINYFKSYKNNKVKKYKKNKNV